MNAPAHTPEKVLVFSTFLVVRKTKKVNLVPGRKIPQFVERTNPLALVGWVWNPVREEKNLHSLCE
jgi:hypothetical protein